VEENASLPLFLSLSLCLEQWLFKRQAGKISAYIDICAPVSHSRSKGIHLCPKTESSLTLNPSQKAVKCVISPLLQLFEHRLNIVIMTS